MTLTNKTVVVTGGSRGIGFEISKLLLHEGASVLAVSRDPMKLQQAQAALSQLGVFEADVSQPKEVDRLANFVQTTWGYLDILVNNAGVFTEGTRELTEGLSKDFWRALEINLGGPYLCTRALLPHLLRSRDPRIVNVGSSSGVMGPNVQGAYGVSKVALHALTIAMARELKDRIPVNALDPGWVRTDMAPDAPSSPDSSAEALVHLVNQPSDITAKLFKGRSQQAWHVST